MDHLSLHGPSRLLELLEPPEKLLLLFGVDDDATAVQPVARCARRHAVMQVLSGRLIRLPQSIASVGQRLRVTMLDPQRCAIALCLSRDHCQ